MIIVLAASLQAQWSNDPNNNLIVGYGLNPDLCSDSAGGCYITYEYGTTGYPRKLGLERLDKYGFKPWGTLKQISGELPEQWYAEIIEDGEGGVIISYLDDLISGSDFIYRVRVQRVDSAGNLLWGQTGVRVTTTEINHGDQSIVGDGNGGCVVIWPNQLQNYTYDYRANRINNLGERVWSDTGIFLENSTDSQPASIVRASDGHYYIQTSTIYRINQNGQIVNQYYGNMLGQPVADPEGGIVLSGKVWTGMIPKLVAQRKDSLGNNLWQEPYLEIADSLDIGTSLNILANNNYYHYGWLGRKNGVAEILQIQSLRDDGTKLFIEESIVLSDSPTVITSIPIIPSSDGSNIYAWTHWNSPQTSNANYARRIDSTGSDIWPQNLVLLNEPSLGYFSMVTDCFGGAIGVGYLNADFAIRVFKVSKYGILGEVITGTDNHNELIIPDEIILYQNYPNPFNSSTIIKYQIPKVETHRDASLQLVKLIVYDVLGNEVATLVNEEKTAGEYEIEFTATGLSSGIYFYKLEAGNFIQTKKMILLK